jgi:tRNA pseudouridine38-40 synthase
VEGVLSDALSRIVGSTPRLSVAGRTDAGVHARGQVASFAAPSPVEPRRIQRALNAMLAPEVVALDVRLAPEGFDARFSATAREYRYRVDTGPWPDPFEARFTWHRPGAVSIAAMRSAARALVGEHDFAAFCRRPPDGGPTVRRLDRLAVSRRGDLLVVSVRANAFLHQMVRSLVGTLVSSGEGSIDPGDVPAILSSGDRSRAGPVAPPHGLTLERVIYAPRREVMPPSVRPTAPAIRPPRTAGPSTRSPG